MLLAFQQGLSPIELGQKFKNFLNREHQYPLFLSHVFALAKENPMRPTGSTVSPQFVEFPCRTGTRMKGYLGKNPFPVLSDSDDIDVSQSAAHRKQQTPQPRQPQLLYLRQSQRLAASNFLACWGERFPRERSFPSFNPRCDTVTSSSPSRYRSLPWATDSKLQIIFAVQPFRILHHDGLKEARRSRTPCSIDEFDFRARRNFANQRFRFSRKFRANESTIFRQCPKQSHRLFPSRCLVVFWVNTFPFLEVDGDAPLVPEPLSCFG